MTPTTLPVAGRLRHSLALVLSLTALGMGALPHIARAEAVDPGATWAPPAETQNEAPQGEPQGEPQAPTAEDDSISQGRKMTPPPIVAGQQAQPDAQDGTQVAPDEKPKVAVVLLHQDLGKPFDMSVIARIMEPLVPHMVFIPLPLVRKAVGRTRLPPSLIHLPKNLQRVGRTVGADFTLVVEAVGHGRTAGVFAGLVDVRSGETVMAKRVPMPTRSLTNSQAIVLVDLIISALGPTTPARGAEAPAAEPAPETAPEVAKQEAASDTKADKADKSSKDSGTAPHADAEGASGPRMGRLMVGLALNQRVAHLVDTQNSGYTPPQYAGNGKSANPLFPGFQLDGEIYSGIATKHRRAWYDQFGLALHLTLAPVLSSTVDTTTQAAVKLKSTVTQLDVYAMYRLLFMPSRALTPSLTLEVGVSRFAFPLTGAQFPGVAFMAPHIGVDVQVPVHRRLLLRLGGGLRPAPSPSGESGKLLGSKSGGFGFVVGGGLLANWRMLEGGLKVQYEHMGISYKGTTSLNGTSATTSSTTPLQFTNIKLTDQLLQILLTVGVAY